jgi:hypothetical protein
LGFAFGLGATTAALVLGLRAFGLLALGLRAFGSRMTTQRLEVLTGNP